MSCYAFKVASFLMLGIILLLLYQFPYHNCIHHLIYYIFSFCLLHPIHAFSSHSSNANRRGEDTTIRYGLSQAINDLLIMGLPALSLPGGSVSLGGQGTDPPRGTEGVPELRRAPRRETVNSSMEEEFPSFTRCPALLTRNAERVSQPGQEEKGRGNRNLGNRFPLYSLLCAVG